MSTRGQITRLTKSATARAETLRRLREKRANEQDKIRKRAMMEMIRVKADELKLIRARIKSLREANKNRRPASSRAKSARPSLAGRPRDARGRLLPTGGAKTPRAKTPRRAKSAYRDKDFEDRSFGPTGRVIYAGPNRTARYRKRPVGDYLTIEEIEQKFGPLPPQMPSRIASAPGRPPRRRA